MGVCVAFPWSEGLGLPIDRKWAPIALLRLRRRIGLQQLGTHDLCRTLSTGLGEMGVDEALIGKILNHVPQSVTRRVYVHADRFDEVSAALEAWGEKVSRLVAPQSSVRVVKP